MIMPADWLGLPNSPSPSSAAAIPTPMASGTAPITASTLLQNLLRQHEYWCKEGRRRLKTGCQEVDEYVLMGGVERGIVLGVSGDAGEGVGRLVAFHLLAAALLSNLLAKASIIDTTGSFPVSLLAQIIRHRIISQRPRNGRNSGQTEGLPGVDEEVEETLERVAISRVFDIEGVWEVLSEISRDWHVSERVRDAANLPWKEAENPESVSLSIGSTVKKCLEAEDPAMEFETAVEQEIEVGDSEAEEDEELDIDLGLEIKHTKRDRLPAEQTSDTVQSNNTPNPTTSLLPAQETDHDLTAKDTQENKETTEIIIIDNMTTSINELFSRRGKSAAHTILNALSRSLHTLSQNHNILTILLNGLTKPGPSATGNNPSTSNPPGSRVSVFSSTTVRPALGRVFDDIVALHVLVTAAPKRKQNAEMLSGFSSPSAAPHSPSSPSAEDERGPEMQTTNHSLMPKTTDADSEAEAEAQIQYTHVLEVLKDECPDVDSWLPARENSNTESTRKRSTRTREQRWAPFNISSDGTRFVNTFNTSIAPKPSASERDRCIS